MQGVTFPILSLSWDWIVVEGTGHERGRLVEVVSKRVALVEVH